MSATWRVIPMRCTNLECPNAADQGQMRVVRSVEPFAAVYRGFSFYVCGPCASALEAMNVDEPSGPLTEEP